MAVILLFFLGLFIAVVLAMRDSTGSAINFLGHRAYYDFPPKVMTLKPGERLQYASLRVPGRTPLCRIYADVNVSGAGLEFVMLDSASLAAWGPGVEPPSHARRPLAGESSVSHQADGGGMVFHMIFRLRDAAGDTARVIVRRFQANCYEKW